MSRLAFLMLMMVCAWSALAEARTYHTTFNVTENPLSESGAWTEGGTTGLKWTNARATPNLAFGTQSGSNQCSPPNVTGCDDSTAIVAGAWAVQHRARGVVTNNLPTGSVNYFAEIELRLNTTITANSITGYECNYSVVNGSGGIYAQIVRWNGALGDFTILTGTNSPPPLVTGDVLECFRFGNGITLRRNGLVVISANDASPFSGGNPGMGFFVQGTTGINNLYGFSSFTATEGAFVSAAGCTQAQVQTAVNSALNNGDVVLIPACSATWGTNTIGNTGLSVTKDITIIGAGESSTIISDNLPKHGTTSGDCTGGVPLIAWTLQNVSPPRITALTIIGVTGDQQPWVCQKGHLSFTGRSTNLRIDHVTFSPAQTVGIIIVGDIQGLIDHLTGNQTVFANLIRVEHLNWNGSSNDAWGDRSWATALAVGSGEGIYIEDSTITYIGLGASIGNFVDCFSGGRIVIRHSVITQANITTHGADSDQRHRGCRWIETYSNDFTYTNINQLAFMAWIRGGSGMFYNNRIAIPGGGYSNKIVQVDNCRDAGATCGGGPNYPPWGTCNGTSLYDQNSSGGYRCVDQPGAGTSNLLGPDGGGTITPANTWVGNALEPIYVYGNIQGTTLANGTSRNVTTGTSNVQSGRDYFANGTTRPGYAAFTYPHPLQSGTSGGAVLDTLAPAAPTNVTVH